MTPFDRASRPVYERKDVAADTSRIEDDTIMADIDRIETPLSDTGRSSRRLIACIAYDGTSFYGFQTQISGNTIQDVLELRLSKLFGVRMSIAASGRTDAGVHARGQVIHLDVPHFDELGKRAAGHLKNALQKDNDDMKTVATLLERTLAADAWRVDGGAHGNLPPDVQVLSVSLPPKHTMDPRRPFHARESCVGKRYVYTIQEGAGHPMTSRYRWKLGRNKRLNVEKMNLAAKRLIGEHDFKTFGVIEEGDNRTPIKRMRRLEVTRIETIDPVEAAAAGCINTDGTGGVDTVVTITAECDRFLYNMARMVAGTLAQVGLGRMEPEDVTALLDRKGRKGGRQDESNPRGLEVTKAPAHGLCLHHCFYEPDETADNWMNSAPVIIGSNLAGERSSVSNNTEDDIQAALALLQL